MAYQWCNKERLVTLKAVGEENKLIFETENEKAEVYIENGDIERVVCKALENTTVITKDQRHHIVVGEGNFQRNVFHYLKPSGPAPFMRLGITKHCGYGTWSSLPHPFELHAELGFEEVFFYLLEGGPLRAIQVGKGVWYDGTKVDEAWFVNDHCFGTIPMGYHPVVGEPGVHVSYIWAYLAKKKEWEKI